MGGSGWDLSWPEVDAVLMDMGVAVPQRAGKWVKVKCPFHADKNASAAINREANVFFCHACNISTTGLGLIMRVENVDTRNAERIAADRYGSRDKPVRADASLGGGLFGQPGNRNGSGSGVPAGGRRRTLLGP